MALWGLDRFFGSRGKQPEPAKLARLQELLSDEDLAGYFAMACYSGKVDVPFLLQHSLSEALGLAREIMAATGMSADDLYELATKQT